MQNKEQQSIYRFRLGVPIWSQNGEEGTLAQLVIDAAQLTLSALGIRLSGIFGRVVYVPFSFVEKVTDQRITLTCSHEQLDLEMHAGMEGVVLDKRSSISRKEEAVRGSLYLLAVEASSGAIHYLVVQHIRMQLLRIGTRFVERIDPGRIRLQGIDQAWNQAVEYYPDEELQQRVMTNIYADGTLRVDWDGIELKTEEGIVTVWGNISSSLRSDIVTDLIRSTEGVLEVHNHLLGDDDLANSLSYQLSRVPEIHELSLGLYPTLGKVRVSGTVANEEQRADILERVRTAKGVRGVTDDLHIGNRVGEILAMSPTQFGSDEDIIPGHYVRHATWEK